MINSRLESSENSKFDQSLKYWSYSKSNVLRIKSRTENIKNTTLFPHDSHEQNF